MNTISETNLEYWIPYFSDIHKTATHVDAFIVTNSFLGDKIIETFSKPALIIRNSLNDEQVSASRVYVSKKSELLSKDAFIIGAANEKGDRLSDSNAKGSLLVSTSRRWRP